MNNSRVGLFRAAIVFAMLLLAGRPVASQEPAASFDFDIARQPLAEALQQFTALTGIQHFFADAAAASVISEAVRGRLTARGALEELLRESGFGARFSDDHTIVLQRSKTTPAVAPPQGKPPSGARALFDGRVIEAVTRAGVPGAQVRILETGQTVATDHVGRFAFPDLPVGEYTLAISYLGYTSSQWPVAHEAGDTTALDYPLQPAGWDVAEVTVFGNRSSRALALNQQRTAENNAEVVSADTLGNFPGTTISEALRRVAGVTFQRDAVTGAGTNILIRGLEPDMNAVKLNGLNLPVGNGNSRSANLGNILADSVSKITIHKTLLPSHDSAGTGGLVEIETKSPLEHPERYVNFAVEGGRRGEDFGDNFLVSGTFARTLGERKNLGLSASVQYTQTLVTTCLTTPACNSANTCR